MHQLYYFGQAYGEGTYGEGAYSCTTEQAEAGTCTTVSGSTGGGPSAGSGGLSDTGIGVLAFVTLACLLIFVSLVVRIWRRPKLALQEVPVEEPQQLPQR
jgi:hypothetical protein